MLFLKTAPLSSPNHRPWLLVDTRDVAMAETAVGETVHSADAPSPSLSTHLPKGERGAAGVTVPPPTAPGGDPDGRVEQHRVRPALHALVRRQDPPGGLGYCAPACAPAVPRVFAWLNAQCALVQGTHLSASKAQTHSLSAWPCPPSFLMRQLDLQEQLMSKALALGHAPNLSDNVRQEEHVSR